MQDKTLPKLMKETEMYKHKVCNFLAVQNASLMVSNINIIP